MWHNATMVLSGRRLALATLFLMLGVCSAFAAAPVPRLDRERCVFRPPRGDQIECYTLVVLENRARPKGPEVRL